VRTEGKDLIAVAREQDIFVADMPEQHACFAKRGE
jgi:hypothetical protein